MFDEDEEFGEDQEPAEEWAPEGAAAKEFDSLLQRYLEAEGAEAEQLREQLLDVYAWPIFEEAIRRRLRGWNEPEGTLEDIWSEARGELGRALETRRHQRDPFRNFPGYVAKAASTAFAHYLREKHPEWHKLKDRLVKTLKEYPSPENPLFALWKTEMPFERGGRRWTRLPSVCGLEPWHHGKTQWRPTRRLLQELRNAHSCSPLNVLEQLGLPSLPPDDPAGRVALLEAIFRWAESSAEEDAAWRPDPKAGPCVVLNELVSTIYELRGIKEVIVGLPDEPGGEGPTQSDDPRSELMWTWEKIGSLLSREERWALLLNLDYIHAFTLVDVRLRDIAAALDLPLEVLAELWGKLPLDDKNIAAAFKMPSEQLGELAPRLPLDDSSIIAQLKLYGGLAELIADRDKVIQYRRAAREKLREARRQEENPDE